MSKKFVVKQLIAQINSVDNFIPMVECKDNKSVLVIFPNRKIHITFIKKMYRTDYINHPLTKFEKYFIATRILEKIKCYKYKNIQCIVNIKETTFSDAGSQTTHAYVTIRNKAGHILYKNINITDIISSFLNEEYYWTPYYPTFINNAGFIPDKFKSIHDTYKLYESVDLSCYCYEIQLEKGR